MEFVTENLGDRLLRELGEAKRADIVVAFFVPDSALLAALQKVRKLRLLVADNYQVNDPDSLETLHDKGQWVRALSGELYEGNLHSKVYLVQRRDKSWWAMVGSANLTRAGLINNYEACIVVDSRREEDPAVLDGVRAWVEELCGWEYGEIDFELARQVFKTRNRGSRSRAEATGQTQGRGEGYWAIKPGWCGEHWNRFLAESVVAIGWGEMGDPTGMSREDVAEAYRAVWDEAKPMSVVTNVAQIMRFTHQMAVGDLVLLCGRYDAIRKDDDVYIYGIARTIIVGGRCYYFDARSKWYRFKRHASIQKVEQYLPRKLVAQALNVGSIVGTIQKLDCSGFIRLEALLRKELGYFAHETRCS